MTRRRYFVKHFRRSRVVQRVCGWLIPLMIAPLLVYYAPPAQAADAGPAAPTGDAGQVPAVIVLDFNTLSGYNGPIVGRSAAAAVSQAMQESDRWDVLSSTQVSAALANLGLTPPLDNAAMMQLGRATEADA